MTDFQEILKFWFEEIKPAAWFQKDEEFDQLLRRRFLKLHESVRQGEAYTWRLSADSRPIKSVLYTCLTCIASRV